MDFVFSLYDWSEERSVKVWVYMMIFWPNFIWMLIEMRFWLENYIFKYHLKI